MTSPRGRIIVSTTNAEGKGVFEPDLTIAIRELPGATIRQVYSVPEVPVPGLAFTENEAGKGIANTRGCNFLEVEVLPGVTTPMHATPSIDFGVMISGEVVLVLDSGEETTMVAGDLYIQKAANHAWSNRGAVPARFASFVAAAKTGDA